MKFTRRPDLDPQTRIDIVKHVWINQGIYGKMTQIATLLVNSKLEIEERRSFFCKILQNTT